MKQEDRYTTTVSVESPLSASALFEHLRHTLRISPSIEAVEYATEFYFSDDDNFPVRVGMEFGENDGHSPLFENEDEDYVELHTPYAELTLSSGASFSSAEGGSANDLHALVLVELAEWFDDHSVDWGYYTDADSTGRWISGEFPKRFGNPDIADLDEIAVTKLAEKD